ncbi:uncharacterized protein [Penaeus vannamei]|uniref:uncharacterized protein n=1 Tax=Penaeus vannamei TaxID=6689 RepID=UPI00387F554F
MERLLKPEKLDCDSNSPTAAQEWRHWLQTFKTFIAVLPQENLNKLGLLINFVSPKIYESISECTTYDDALTTLQSQFVKPTNEVFARHRLATRRQEPGESLDVYFRALKILSKECNFKAVTATQHCEEYMRDAFISGLQSPAIRQRLLENKTLESESVLAASATKAKCFFCGLLRHPRSKCRARDAVCHKCQKKGHFSKVCRSSSVSGSVTPNNSALLATITSAATPSILLKAVARVSINGIEADGLIDSGSSESFIHPDLVKHHSLNVQHSKSAVTMASTSLSAHTSGVCEVNIKVNGRDYESVRLTVLPKLCSDLIAILLQRYSTEDRAFIEKEVQRLLKEGIIEPSNSPWRARGRRESGVACFQRIMDSLIKEEGLAGTYAYLDDATICGMTQQEHDDNLNKFLEAAARRNMTYNEDKCTIST